MSHYPDRRRASLARLAAHRKATTMSQSALRPVNHLLPTKIEKRPGSWSVVVEGSITDEQAAGITWWAQPEQVVLGEFVEVTDHGGTRIGHVSNASYHERLAGPAYVIITIRLR